MMHVCFGLHDKTGHYSKFTGTAMLSIFENTNSEVTVHILHDNTLTQDNREKFIYLAGRYGQAVKFYNVEKLFADKIKDLEKLLPLKKDPTRTIGMFFRFLISDLLMIKKTIYLDSDIVVNLDINELWQTELGDAPLAAVPEMRSYVPTNSVHYLCREGFVKAEDFFNSGVLIMNLEKFRLEEDKLKLGIKFKTEHPECDGNDQPILNYCFAEQTVKLPLKFNVLVEYARMNNDFETKERICHYITSVRGRGYGLDSNDPFNRLWIKYFVKTPWFDAETIGRLYAAVQNLHVELKQTMINLSAAMSGKTRAFILFEKDLNTLVKNFSVRNDEEVILVKVGFPLEKMINVMNASRNEKIFFIMLPNFPYQILIQAGFVEGKDFFNAYNFLSEAQGVPLNSYQLIKSM